MADIASFIGALAITGLITMWMVSLVKAKSGGFGRVVAVNLLSLAICTTLAGFGFAESGETFVPLRALPLYGSAQVVCFLLILFARSRRKIIEPVT
jgi:hypothetical protein